MRRAGCLFVLVLLLLAAAGLWAWYEGWLPSRMALAGQSEAEFREPPSEALAASAAAKLERLRGGGTDSVALGAAELESLLLYRHAGLLPGFIDDPRIRLERDRLALSGQMAVERLPHIGELRATLALLPDTVDVALSGRVSALDQRRAALSIDALEIAGMPIPPRLFPPLLDRLGRAGEAGLPEHAIALPLPPGVRSIYVRADSLVLIRRGGDAAADEN